MKPTIHYQVPEDFVALSTDEYAKLFEWVAGKFAKPYIAKANHVEADTLVLVPSSSELPQAIEVVYMSKLTGEDVATLEVKETLNAEYCVVIEKRDFRHVLKQGSWLCFVTPYYFYLGEPEVVQELEGKQRTKVSGKDILFQFSMPLLEKVGFIRGKHTGFDDYRVPTELLTKKPRKGKGYTAF